VILTTVVAFFLEYLARVKSEDPERYQQMSQAMKLQKTNKRLSNPVFSTARSAQDAKYAKKILCLLFQRKTGKQRTTLRGPSQQYQPRCFALTNGASMCIFIHKRRCIMRTNIVIDDKLVEEAMILSGAKTKKELISKALREFVTTRKRLNLLDLDGKIEFEKAYDYKGLREGQ